MTLRRKVLQSSSSPGTFLSHSYNNLTADKLYNRESGTTNKLLPTSTLPRITIESDVLKSIADLEEYVEEAYPGCLNTNPRGDASTSSEDCQFWCSIRKQMLEIAELTCQTNQFDKCCLGDSDCPFASSVPLPKPNAINLRRRCSSPVTLSSYSTQREVLVSYGGFESIVNTNSHDSDFVMDKGYDQTWSKNSVTFRRDLHAPLRRKKHHSYPSNSTNENNSQLLIVQERFTPAYMHLK